MTDGAARDAILERTRASLADRPASPEVPRGYNRGTIEAGIDPVERFAERVASYRASVTRCAATEVGREIAAVLGAIPADRFVAPARLPEAWLAPAPGAVGDDPALTHEQLNGIPAVVTGCAVAIAETGTIVLDAGPGQGRRALTLLPDHHLCIVRADQVVPDVATALERLDPRRPLTWISGPSATSDIELQRIEGVHGPRNLHVLIVTPAEGSPA
jgi:L-lactate dehydrogenase complex protein LldG